MESARRKAVIAAYKERDGDEGVYALRCGPTAQVWVGQAPDLRTIRNRLWFTLRQGGNPHRTLQEAWNRHGEGAFTFEVLERLEPEEIAYVRAARLKDCCARWRHRLGANPL